MLRGKNVPTLEVNHTVFNNITNHKKTYTMKNLSLILLAILTLFACNKEDDVNETEELLKGFWILEDVTGGIAGTGYEVDFDQLKIGENEDYALMFHDSVLQEGSYDLREEDNSVIIQFVPNGVDSIFFDDQDKTIIFSEEDSKLTLSDPCCDLFVYAFNRE